MHTNRLAWISILFFLQLFPFKEVSADFHFTHYTSSSGLSDNNVLCAFKDSRGFMWFGTNDGLNRFDGREFIVYKNKATDANSIPGNQVNRILEDRDGILWIATGKGLCSYDFRTNNFQVTDLTKTGIKRFKNANVNSMALSKNGDLWIGFENGGLCMYNIYTKEIVSPDKFGMITIYDITPAGDGTVYFSPVGRSLNYFRHKIFSATADTGTFPYPAHTLNSIFCDSKNNIWCGAWDNALHRYHAASDRFEQFDFEKTFNYSGNEILCIHEDRSGLLWLGTKTDGLYFFNAETKLFQHYFQDKSNPQSLKCNRVNFIFRDEQDRMWLATDAGVYVYDPLLNQFEITRLPNSNAAQNINQKIYDFYIDKNKTLYIGAADGLYRKMKNEKTFTEKIFIYKNNPLNITKLFCTRHGNMYVGTNKTMFHYDPSTNEISTIAHVNNNAGYFNFLDIPSSRINSIAEGTFMNDTFLFVSAYGHGELMIHESGDYGLFSWITDGTEVENLVRKIVIDHTGKPWFAGASKGIFTDFSSTAFTNADGLWRKNPSLKERMKDSIWNFKATRYNKGGSQQYGLQSLDVYDMIENDDGTFWVSTNGGGLHLFNPNDSVKTFIHFTSEHLSMQGMAKDNAGNLWIISSGGIDFFDTKSKTFHRFETADGIPEEGLAGYIYRDDEGNMYAGGNGYYVTWNPGTLVQNKTTSPVYITHLKILDEAADSLLRGKEIKLNYQQNFLSFEFASLNYTKTDRNRYEYFLEGIDKGWRSNGTGTKVTYTNLPAGTFTLHARAYNNDGFPDGQTAEFRFTIVPPFYKTGWFYVLCIVTVAAILYGIYRYRINQLLKLHSMRNRIARDLHDDIGSTLGSISFYSEVAKNSLEQKNSDSIRQVIERIGDTSREMMDNIGDIVWAVNPQHDTAEEMIQRMQHFAGTLCSSKNITLDFFSDHTLKEVGLKMEQRKNIFLIFKEALHNALKYADCKSISISLKKSGKFIRMEIRDDGKGFQPVSFEDGRGEAYNGNGLKNMKTRAGEINATLSIRSGKGKGTAVVLDFSAN